ncbi:hypothetical protein CPB86DRAFT_755026 [Serendipita vermifera]|nr:hypothetical protein CPB86DRAFT_755026 [Serendipita vermifera]
MAPRILSTLALILLVAASVIADDFECSASTTISNHEYDMTSLNIPMTAQRTRDTPPTTMVDTLLFNICSELESKGLPAGDECPTGTRACLTKTNKKDGQTDRIIAVIPLATKSALTPLFQTLSDKPGVSLLLHGDVYPEGGSAQSLNVTLLCASEASDPKLIDYTNNLATVEWSTPAACAKNKNDAPHDPPPDGGSTPGNGIGWFFFLFFLCLGAYFAIGAYHNYTTYGASGWDLVPHRDFWRDVPFLLRDLAQHLLSSVRGGPSRGGYHAV